MRRWMTMVAVMVMLMCCTPVMAGGNDMVFQAKGSGDYGDSTDTVDAFGSGGEEVSVTFDDQDTEITIEYDGLDPETYYYYFGAGLILQEKNQGIWVDETILESEEFIMWTEPGDVVSVYEADCPTEQTECMFGGVCRKAVDCPSPSGNGPGYTIVYQGPCSGGCACLAVQPVCLSSTSWGEVNWDFQNSCETLAWPLAPDQRCNAAIYARKDTQPVM